LIGILLFRAPVVWATNLEFGSKTILVYSNVSGDGEARFILRIVRFRPDIFLEWESVAQQGTIHFYRDAVEEGEGLALSRLFDNGVDVESEKVMSKWLPLASYQSLIHEGRVKINLNNYSAQLKLKNESTYEVKVDGQPTALSVILVQDNRRGDWTFLKDPENPLLIEYKTPYYREFLESITTQGNGDYRWVRQIPPIK